MRQGQTHDLMARMTKVVTLPVVLFYEKGVDPRHPEEVVSWFQRFPGPVSVTVKKKPVELELRDGVLPWETAFSKLDKLRQEGEVGDQTFLSLLTCSSNEKNWFAVESDKQLRNSFVHVGDFSWMTSAPDSIISTHYLLKAVFNCLVTEAGVPWQRLVHKKIRGCFYDFCEEKIELNLKLRTADICGDCMEAFHEIGIPDSLIQQTVEIMEASRRSALNTGKYLKQPAVFDRWPFPVAVTRHKAVQATNPLLKFLLLLDHFDSLVRYFYLANELVAGRKPTIDERPSMGWWLDQLAHSLRGERHFRDVVRIAQQEKVVALRNEKRGHGWMSATEESYRDDAKHLEDVLTRIEEELTPFLDAYHMVLARDVRLLDDTYILEGEHLMGSNCFHPPLSIKLHTEPRSIGVTAENEVFLTNPTMNKFWKVAPYIVAAVCPTCRHPRILVTDGGRQFIDVFVGHRVEMNV
jgi:hypothetical protein